MIYLVAVSYTHLSGRVCRFRKWLSDNGRNASDGCAVMQPLRIIIERKPAAVRKTLI